jgi:type VI protein secretion system component VasF
MIPIIILFHYQSVWGVVPSVLGFIILARIYWNLRAQEMEKMFGSWRMSPKPKGLKLRLMYAFFAFIAAFVTVAGLVFVDVSLNRTEQSTEAE